MSVTQQRPFNFGFRKHEPRSVATEFEELEVKVEPAAVEFKCTHENGNVQLIVLWCSVFIFMIYVVSVIPWMRLTAMSNALAIIIGLVVLATIGLLVQARVRTTLIRLAASGIHIEQGTVLDREVVEMGWHELAGVELEPVDPKHESQGMHLELRPKEGEPIRVLAGIGVGDLNAVRQAVLKAWRGSAA